MKQALLHTIVGLMLLAFAGIGIAHILKPDYFMKRFGVRKGGELLTEWNRLGLQIPATIFAGLAISLPYVLFRR